MMMETTESPMFTDADLTHRWARDLRVPLVTSLPQWNYEAALLVPSHAEGAAPDPDAFDFHKAIWPTDEEAAVIGSYIDYRVDYWYTEGWQARMRARALDVDSSTNTTIFRKKVTGWTYTKRSFTESLFYPAYNKPQHTPDKSGLIALIEGLNRFGSGDVSKHFAEWMAAHPDVWTVEA